MYCEIALYCWYMMDHYLVHKRIPEFMQGITAEEATSALYALLRAR